MMAPWHKQSHRTVSRVRSLSSPLLIALFLAISTSAAAAVIPFLETAVVHGTGFVFVNADEVNCVFFAWHFSLLLPGRMLILGKW